MRNIFTQNVSGIRYGKRNAEPNVLGLLLLSSDMNNNKYEAKSAELIRTKRNFLLKKKQRIA